MRVSSGSGFGGEICSSLDGAKVVFEQGCNLSLTINEGNSTSATAVENLTPVHLSASLSNHATPLSYATYTFASSTWRP